MKKTVLILGASGRFGHNSAEAFEKAGWSVRRFDRKSQDLTQAAWGTQLIVNAWNPLYPDWSKDVPRLTQQVINVARKTGATVLIPGNVYNFGADAPPPWGEESRQMARNPLGRIRIDMEQAYKDSGVRTIILRAGDFIDTQPSGNWFDLALIKKLDKGIFTYPGNPDIPHAWAYLPDLARVAVGLAEQGDQLPTFANVHFPGYTLTGHEMRQALERVTGSSLKMRRFSYLPFHLARPFWPLGAKLLEMRYLWSTPHWLTGEHLHEILPEFRDTPLEIALASAIKPHSVEGEIDPDKAMAAG